MTILRSLRRVALPLGAAAISLFAAAAAHAVQFSITYSDRAGYGFNDRSYYNKPPFSPSSPGTLGAARRAALQAVVGNWAGQLDGNIPITVDAAFEAMGGAPNGSILAYAGPTYVIGTATPEIPLIWAVGANAAEAFGQDYSPGDPMIVARFNSDVDGSYVLGPISFYYGVDGAAGDDVDFYSVTLHEFGHGLGFLSLTDEGVDGEGNTAPTGQYALISGKRAPSVFDVFMADMTSGTPVALTSMSTADRKAALLGGNLYFNGPNAVARNHGQAPKLFAPSPWQSGSSASHLDEDSYQGTNDSPSSNELMTPYAGPGSAHASGPAVTGIFQDMRYTYTPYTIADAAAALRAVGGLGEATPNSLARQNVTAYTTFPGKLDLDDALKIARMAAGAEPNPNP